MSSLTHNAKGGEAWRDHFNAQLQNLERIVEYPEFGPRRPPSDVVSELSETVRQIGSSELPPPKVLATSEGGIQVKWRRPGSEFSIMVYPDHTLEYLLVSGSGPSRVVDSGDLIPSHVNVFVARFLSARV
jgi:hypothetical protein